MRLLTVATGLALLAAAASASAQAPAADPHAGHGAGHAQQGAAAGPAARPDGGPAAMFAKADADKDGALSKAEWLAAGRQERGFQFMDANADGKLTPAELKAGREKMGQRRAN